MSHLGNSGLRSQRAVRELSESLSEEEEAFRRRALRGEAVAYLCMDTGDEPLRRWGNKPGVRWVWAIGDEGRKVLLRLSTTTRESEERWLEVLRELARRGMPPPATSTPEGAPGRTTAVDTMWPQSVRIRGWFQKLQKLPQKVPAAAWPAFKAVVVDMRAAPPRPKAEERRAQLGAQ